MVRSRALPLTTLVTRLVPKLGAVVLASMLVAACSQDPATPPGATPGTTVSTPSGGPGALPARTVVDLADVKLVAALDTAGDCDGLLAKLRAVGDAHVGPYGFGYSYSGYGYDGYGVSPVMSRSAEDSSAASGLATGLSKEVAAPAAPGGTDTSGFSGTNNQQAGVDEADLVKTDGKLLIIARSGLIVVIDVSGGPAAARQLSSIDAPKGSDMNQLFFDGTHVMVIGSRYQEWPTVTPTATQEQKGATSPPQQDPAEIAASMPGPRTVVQMINVADPAAPRVTDTVEVDGQLAAARLVNGRARLVVRSEPLALPFVSPQSPVGEPTSEQMNRRILAEAPLEQWVPHLWRDSVRADLVSCDRVYIPETFAGLSMTSIVTLPLAADQVTPETTSLLAPGDVTYTSEKSLYVTAQAWVDPRIAQQGGSMPEISDWKTAVHRFAIDGDGPATYVASGQVDGTIRNSFALGEVGDHLGIATTKGTPWGISDTSESSLITMRVNGSQLVQAGAVGGLGEGESIRSVRFVGRRAYVVTFRQTDPFYVIDLSNPDAPRLAGELKLLGYSGYLHPIAENRILGIGRAADDKGRDEGMLATLFDTTDPAAPKVLGSWTDPNGWSNVDWDHHAFLYWDATKLALFPQSGSGINGNEAPEMVGLRVGDALTEAGRIRITPPADKGATQCKKLSSKEVSDLTGQGASYYTGGGGFIQLCDPGKLPGASGYSCYPVSSGQIVMNTGGKTPAELGLGDKTVEMCNENGFQPIERSIVIGDTVWVLAGDTLQANDLATLAPGPQLRVG